jgi:hypothetical protein
LSIERAIRDLCWISNRSFRPDEAGGCNQQGNRFYGLHRAISLHMSMPLFSAPELRAADRSCKMQGGLKIRVVLCNLQPPTGSGRPTPREKMKRRNALQMRLAASIFREDLFQYLLIISK